MTDSLKVPAKQPGLVHLEPKLRIILAGFQRMLQRNNCLTPPNAW